MRYTPELRRAIGAMLREHCITRYGSPPKAAEAWGIGATYLWRVTRGVQPAPQWMLDKAGIVLVPQWARPDPRGHDQTT